VSSPGRGSTFTLYLPVTYAPRGLRKSASELTAGSSGRMPKPTAAELAAEAPTNGEPRRPKPDTRAEVPVVMVTNGAAPVDERMVNEVGDDREDIQAGDRVLLIVENDLAFARFVLDAARDKGFKGLVTSLGAAALALARDYKPDAVSLDIFLPDMQGWRVLERLKNDVATRHIPVCIISTDDSREQALSSGALAFIVKPIQSRDVLDGLLDFLGSFLRRPRRELLVIEPDAERRARVVDFLGADDVEVIAAQDTESARRALAERSVDCVVLDTEAAELVDGLIGDTGEPVYRRLPVVLYGDRDVSDEAAWRRLDKTCTLRRAHSPARLLDLTAFYLHRNLARLPEAPRQQLFDLHQSDKSLAGKKVLIVDDDMRNIFALSTVLEEHDMVIVSADNGRDAIKVLHEEEDVDIVLMDIMMPEMDGMETMREIRKVPRLKNLPIVAVTAKAMKGDREKCIEAGAWDYLSKPVDPEQMLAVLRAWLHR
jgi:CheY-like chemotaxis protein